MGFARASSVKTTPQDLRYFIPFMPLTAAASQGSVASSKSEVILPFVIAIDSIAFNYTLNHVNVSTSNNSAKTRIEILLVAINGETQQQTILYTFADQLNGTSEQTKSNAIEAPINAALDHLNNSYYLILTAAAENASQFPAPRFARINWVKINGKK